jgi:MFS family permease
VQIGAPLGLVTSSGVFALVTMMPEADFKSWGWRIPFLLSILLLGVGWFVRARVPETPIFEEIKRRGAISSNPFIEAIFKNPGSFLVAVGLKISEVSWFYILTFFIVVYATSQLNLPRALLLNAILIAALVAAIAIPLFGWLSDHIGRRIFYFFGTFFTACFAFPLFWLHWTREGLLSPVGSPHSGTGKHRRYDGSSVYDAAILNAVASAGLHVVAEEYLLDALSRARRARRKWQRAGTRGPLWLEISHRGARSGTAIAIHEGAVHCDPDAELSIVINLAQIFADVGS